MPSETHTPLVAGENVMTVAGVAAQRADNYRFLWAQVKRLAPQAVLLRGPVDLNPVQWGGGLDLDVLLPTEKGRQAVKAFLCEHGFCREYCPQAYIERYKLWLAHHPQPFNVDLYTCERWGPGFQCRDEGNGVTDPRLACLLRAVVDGKGTAYFEARQSRPPWQEGEESGRILAGPIGRALWRAGRTRALTLYFLFTGIIRPDFSLILQNLLRRIAFRCWQLRRRLGLEVGLIGVDGTGKSSIAAALLRLPVPVIKVYLGEKEPRTWIWRRASGWDLPYRLRVLVLSYELLMRRLYGWFAAFRGYIVIYDRHPIELLEPQPASVKERICNLLFALHAWPVDLTFWLTGDYVKIYKRKQEQPVARLEEMGQHIRNVLRHYSIAFTQIDVTKEDLDSVVRTTADRILAMYCDRASIDNLPRTLRTILA